MTYNVSSGTLNSTIPYLSTVTDCVNTVTGWMQSNRPQLNNDKTEFMWCATVCRQHHLPITGPTIVSSLVSFTVTPSSMARDRCVYIVQRTISRCFAVPRQLCTIWRQTPTSVFQSLTAALVLSRLDYCNSILF